MLRNITDEQRQENLDKARLSRIAKIEWAENSQLRTQLNVLVESMELLLRRLEKMPSKLWTKEQLGAILKAHYESCETEQGQWVEHSSYTSLQAEYEQLVSYTKNGIECFANPCSDHSGINTPPFYEFQERYGQLCLMCVVDERDALLVAAEQQPDVTQLVEALDEMIDVAERVDSWESFPSTPIERAQNALAAYRNQGGDV